MKASEYFAKHKDRLDDERQMVKLFIEMCDEVISIAKIRHIVLLSGMQAVVKEVNQKWNVLATLVEKEKGHSILKQDGFTAYWLEKFPILKLRR